MSTLTGKRNVRVGSDYLDLLWDQLPSDILHSRKIQTGRKLALSVCCFGGHRSYLAIAGRADRPMAYIVEWDGRLSSDGDRIDANEPSNDL